MIRISIFEFKCLVHFNIGIIINLSGCYDSTQCKPGVTEIELLHHFVTRKEILVKDKAREIAPDGRKTRTDHGLLEWLKVIKLCLHSEIRDLP